MKLFTIGDSISQGFMSGAAACTNLCYSTIIADQLGATNYHYPTWEKGGQPVNIEDVFRKLQRRLGKDISGLFEWPIALNLINNYIDEVEDYYERGQGNLPVTMHPYHNLAVRGFDISSSWQITCDLCESIISTSGKNDDNWWGLVNESFLRTARTLLTGGRKEKENFSQLDWLNYHHQSEGVENIILWLGANNALGTILDLSIRQTSNDGKAFEHGPENVSFAMRRKKDWNLWHPEDFRVEYQYMLDKVIQILEVNPHEVDYKVYVGTVPLVTIAPLIKAVGGMDDLQKVKTVEWPVNPKNPVPMTVKELSHSKEVYYSYAKYYTYFPFSDNFNINDKHLNFQEVLHIDNCIRKYNRIIQELIMEANQKLNARKFYLVDIGSVLSAMALKRNNMQPTYEFPEYFDYVHPRPDTRYYGTTRKGEIKAGGIFSLDGVHPSGIGQGLLAYEFLKVMKVAGTYKGNPNKDINWQNIFDSDTLYSQPIGLLGEIYDNTDLARWVINTIGKIKSGVKV